MRVNINPVIAVGVTPPALIDVQAGVFGIPIVFSVHANKQEVTFFAEASNLFKADDPTGTTTPPIPVDIAVPATLRPDNGNPLNGDNNKLAWGSPGSPIAGFPSAGVTVQKLFQSSQPGVFSQNVTLTVTYNQDNPERPVGQYSGKVKLTGLLLQ